DSRGNLLLLLPEDVSKNQDSEIQFQPKLDLAASRRTTRQLPERWIRCVARSAGRTDTGEGWAVCRRKVERWCVAKVKKLAAKLKPKTFGEVDVLEDGNIRVLRPRPPCNATGRVAKLLDGCTGDARGCARNAERSRIEVSVNAPVAEHHGR